MEGVQEGLRAIFPGRMLLLTATGEKDFGGSAALGGGGETGRPETAERANRSPLSCFVEEQGRACRVSPTHEKKEGKRDP